MPQPSDVEAVADALAEVYQRAWHEIEARREEVLRSLNPIRRQETLDRLGELQTTVEEQLRVLADAAVDFVNNRLPYAYARGAQDAGIPNETFSWTQQHLDALAALAQDTYDDLLAASAEVGRTSHTFAQQVRDTVRGRLPQSLLTDKTPTRVAQEIADELRLTGITAVTYRDGSTRTIDTYARMVSRTKTAVAYNAGTLNMASSSGASWMEVFDGPTCGWAGHVDGDKPDGTIRSVTECSLQPISHPNCVRAFGARPDLVTQADAANAEPSTTPEQRGEAARLEEERAAEMYARSVSRAAQSRREARAAARAERASI